MLRTRAFLAVAAISMLAGALLHAVWKQPSANAQDAQTPLNRQQPIPGSHGVAVLCQVEGGGVVLTLAPEGTVVKKGDMVCELEASRLRDRLTDREIAVKQSEKEA